MPRRLVRIVALLAPVFVLLLLLSSPLTASSARQPARLTQRSHAEIATASDSALTRLSPDLREAVQAGDASSHLVFALIEPGTQVERYMIKAVTSRRFGELQWVTGRVETGSLAKLASAPGVLAVTSSEAFQPLPAPGLDEMTGQAPAITRERINALLAAGGKDAVLRATAAEMPALPAAQEAIAALEAPAAVDTVKVRDIHRATEAHAAGYTGEGVVAAVIDTGVDFGTTDLQGTQAHVDGGPYDGWPYAYDTLSGAYYALDSVSIGPDNYWEQAANTLYAHTFPVEGATCADGVCSGELTLDFGAIFDEVTLDFTWPDSSKSGNYLYSVHPDYGHLLIGFYRGLGYANSLSTPAALIVADETTAGVYDTVYVDADFDQDLVEEKPMSKGDELSGADIYGADWGETLDGLWDLSVSMLSWIADGENPPPGVGVLYPDVAVPEQGRLIAFVGDADAHGTNVASMIAAQSIVTDPYRISHINPRFAGGAEAGGVGGPVMAGMAPDAQIAAFMNGFILPYDAWTLATLGFDGQPQSGDEAQVVNNSWGDSSVVNDGWDETARVAQYLNKTFAPSTLVLAATGNGGPGYGTTTTPNGGTILKVGASTSYGTSTFFEDVSPDLFTYGAIQPWSNRGPSGLGDVDPDLVCVGAWGQGATPLNRLPNGAAAYDLFGGTSMSSPVCAGIATLVYQSFQEAHGRWPTWQESTDILLNSAIDLGYNALAQGAGNADALRATAIAAGDAAYVTPSQWQVGDYHGEDLTPGFPAIVHPGESKSLALTFHNPTDAPVTSAVEDVTLLRTHEISFTVTLGASTDDEGLGLVPTYLRDITDLVDEYDPDLMSAHILFPQSRFDELEDYYSDNVVTTLFYDWKDLNGDGNLWTDDNNDGAVQAEELDRDHADGWEFNRYTYAYAEANYQLADLGRDALSRRHDGVFLGLQRNWGVDDLDVTIQIIFYQKADWDWLSFSAASVNIPANGEAVLTATMAVPADARLGVYEGAIEYDGHVLPVIAQVAANSTTFDFGAASLEETLGDTPYDNGHLLGSTDWGWRPETGDWKQFFYDVPEGAADAGTGMIVTTEWQYPQAIEAPPLPEAYLYETFDSGIPASWAVVDNLGACPWLTNADFGMDNLTGGEGLAATTSSNACFDAADTELYTPIIDLTDADQAWLAFRTHFIGGYDWELNPLDHAIVEISTDEGLTWTELLDWQTDFYGPWVIDLSAHAGSEVLLRFHYRTTGWSYWWQLDNVGVFAEDPTPGYNVPQRDLTDVNTALFGASEDDFSAGDPGFFGPTGLGLIGASRDTWLTGGKWAFYTETGGAKEIVGGIASDGLGLLSLHNVLNAGRVVGEPVVGHAYQLSVDPAPLTAEATTIAGANPPTMAAQIDATVEATADIPDGLSMLAFGPSQLDKRPNRSITQEIASSPCSAKTIIPVTVIDGGLLEVTTTSAEASLDIDLYLLLDDGDGAFTCNQEYLVAQSTTVTADEHVSVKLPEDGKYFILIHGYSVPKNPSLYDLTIRAIQGHGLTLSNVPDGALAANTPVPFQIDATVAYKPDSTWEGLLFLGPKEAPLALNIPVTITVPELAPGDLSARLNTAPDALSTGEQTTASLRVWNNSLDAEVVRATINVPPGLTVDPASLSVTAGQTHFNVLDRTITWTGLLDGSSGATLTFQATAATAARQVEMSAQVQGVIRGDQLRLTTPLWLNVDRPPILSHLPVVARN